ncbi:MAG: tRNA (guanosine(37)-N1)-methyltransferase TrmD [Proteobacteria bacterium]|nr:tRNA (guanosine(37)-N1)-methyltransferase TrmD [Pseudomonadota bacterium]
MKFIVLTLFPEMFPGPLKDSVLGKALEDGLWEIETLQIRDFATDKHATVDDRVFGGGSGMLMKPNVMEKAIEAAKARSQSENPRIIYFSPRGQVFNQKKADELSKEKDIILLCGRYEGIDERVIEHYGIEEISLGDFVLSGGEIPALAVIDACVRHIYGVLGNHEALKEESFGSGNYAGLLEYPHYTRPAEWKGLTVPEVLLSGNHAQIDAWRLEQAERVTRERRKDLWDRYSEQKAKQPPKKRPKK